MRTTMLAVAAVAAVITAAPALTGTASADSIRLAQDIRVGPPGVRVEEDASMRRLASTAILLALMTTVASAQTVQPRNDQNRVEAGPPAQILTSIPTEGVTVTPLVQAERL